MDSGDLRGVWIVLGPYSNEFIEMMGSKNGGISRKIVKVIHDDSHEQIEHLECFNMRSVIVILHP